MPFEDNFSTQAPDYARYRPYYPETLFAYLAAVAPGHQLAWDCGTGNGQAAHGLAAHFAQIVATDASSAQIANALPHKKIRYRVLAAEQTDLDAHSVDLVTVAQALHWFDLDAFYAEARRVLKPTGVLAVWCYHLSEVAPDIDRILTRYNAEVVGPYWSERIALVNAHYRSLSFPFQELDPPAFTVEAWWDLNDVVGYLNSWSATQRFLQVQGYSPVDAIRQELAAAWGPPEHKRPIRWPLYIRAGRPGFS